MSGLSFTTGAFSEAFEPFLSDLSVFLHAVNANKKQKPPQNEIPAGSVPEPSERPDDENVPQPFCLGHAVAAEGDVQVLLEPCAERNVPAPPKFRYAL